MFAYQVSTRPRESDLLARARDNGVEHIVEVHGWDDLWTLKDSVEEVYRRGKEYVKRPGLDSCHCIALSLNVGIQ